MDAFLSFLIFAGLFYLMMRFGCGAHVIHGHGSGHHHDRKDKKADQSIDPVCGEPVPWNEGYGKMESGHLYRFCSRRCLDDFESDPQRYMQEHEERMS